MSIKVGEKYKYKEICAIRGEKEKTGKSRQLQIKDWERYYKWANPTTQTYLITEVRETPDVKIDNRGGYRDGAGAKVKVQEEFDFLFRALINRDFNRNSCGDKVANLCTTYFTNKEICLYFGFFGDDFYSADRINDKEVNEDAFQEVGAKIREKLNSWVYRKIERLPNTELTHGILAYQGQGSKRNFDYKDEWLEDWNKYQAEYLKLKGYGGLYEVFDNDEYTDMVDWISRHFEGYTTVLKCRKVNFNSELIREYEWDKYEDYRGSLNIQLVNELKRYFHKKYTNATDYDYIIDTYVRRNK